MDKNKKISSLFFVVATYLLLPACSPYQKYCSNVEQCAKDNEAGFKKIDVESDFHNVCVAKIEGIENVLRSNEEQECEEIADLYLEYYSCLSQLSCSELHKQNSLLDAGICDSEYKKYSEAKKEHQEQCQTTIIGSCNQSSASSSSIWALILSIFYFRRKEQKKAANLE